MKSITTLEDRKHMSDGRVSHLIAEEEISHVKFFSHVTLEGDQEVKYHEHHGEYEIYYILSGEGIYSDNGVETTVKAGDVTYTPSGKGHSLKTIDGKKVEFIAVIVVE